MQNQTQSSLVSSLTYAPNVISLGDREILRSLAAEVARLAARSVESEKRRLWTDHNELRETRPLIFCDPEFGWREIITDAHLQTTGQLAREWETRLRKEILWATLLKDDRVIQPFFDIAHIYHESDWGMKERRIGGEHGGSFIWESPLKSYDDLDKLRHPVITVDRDATDERLALAQETFGDLLPIRLRTKWWWTLGLTRMAANLRGMEQLMLDMYDYPDELHRLMAFLRDGHLARLDFLEQNNLLGSNQEASYVGSGGFGFTRELAPATRMNDLELGTQKSAVKTREMWGFCESQETVGIGPDTFAEFVFPYQEPVLDRFGLNCYGCCEPLHLRWKVIKNAPRLRRVSVSPWADIDQMAEALSDQFIFSYKPSPTDLAMPNMDENLVRSRLTKLRNATRGCRVEVIMKDNHTLGGSGHNAVRWVQIARECLV